MMLKRWPTIKRGIVPKSPVIPIRYVNCHPIKLYSVIESVESRRKWYCNTKRCVSTSFYNLLLFNEICRNFRIFRMLSRHSITSFHLTRYVKLSGYSGYSAVMHNTKSSIMLWQMRSSDYAAVMRKSIPDQEM